MCMCIVHVHANCRWVTAFIFDFDIWNKGERMNASQIIHKIVFVLDMFR